MREEIIIDAQNKSLGRLGTEIVYYLLGKHRPDYDPSKDKEIFVLIKNLDKVRFTGKKFDQETFLRHTGYIGHLKEIPLKDLWSRNKLEVLRLIIKNMLPKNKLRKKRLLRIKLIENGTEG
jgi:large subunit ribosomal protein L13